MTNLYKPDKSKDELVKGDNYKQDAFTELEMTLHPLWSMCVGSYIFKVICLDAGLMGWIIRNSPEMMQMFGHGIMCMTIAFWLFIACLMIAIYIKYLFHCVIGIIYGIRPLSAWEDFWLYDIPVNPIMMPSLCTFNKIDMDPDEFVAKVVATVRAKNLNCKMKLVKHFGKYYFQELNDEEYDAWVKTNTGILTHITNDAEANEFMLKLKRLPGKTLGANSVSAYFIPSMNNGKESAVITCGHHTNQDGVSQMQVGFSVSDDHYNSEYPFLSKKPPAWYHWLIVYLTFPVGVYQILHAFLKHRYDINCIKKHSLYIAGKYNTALPTVISVAKAKAVGKKYDGTMNDIIMAMVTKVLKKHFIMMKDNETEVVTFTVPFTFKTIPKNPDEYVFDNCVVGLSVYVRLTESLVEGIAQSKKMMDDFKTSLIPMASFVMMQLYNFFGSIKFNANFALNLGKKHTLLFSNVPGYLKPVRVGGQAARRMWYLGSMAGSGATSITMISIDKRLQINVNSDEYHIKDVKAFVELFNTEIRELGIAYDSDEEGHD